MPLSQYFSPPTSFEISPSENGPSRAVPNGILENPADRDELSAAAESKSTEAVHEACSSQDEGTDANGDRRVKTQPQLQIVQPSSQTFSTEIEIDFRQLDDGCRLEIVEDPADATKTKLAIFDGGKVQLVSKFEYGGNIFIPIARESDGLRDVVLPHGPNPYFSTEEILSRISALIGSCVSLSPSYLNILAAFVVYSWFADELQPPVYLIVTGLPQSGKSTLLEAMRLLCRRSLLVGEITAAGLLDSCSRFTPTLLIDENDWQADRSSRALRKQLRSGTSVHLLSKNLHKTQKGFGAKILSSPELPDDPALLSRCLHIPMSETDRVDLRKPWDPEIVDAADALQGSLLQLRLEKYRSIAWRLVTGAEQLRPRSRDLLGSLLAALPIDSAAEKLLLKFFRDVHNPSNMNLLSPAQHAVVAGLFNFVHIYPVAGYAQVAKIAEFANASLKASGERFVLSPRKLTSLLASLGFGDILRSCRGSQRAIDQEAIRKIHILGRDHKITLVNQKGIEYLVRSCNFCSGPSSVMFTRASNKPI